MSKRNPGDIDDSAPESSMLTELRLIRVALEALQTSMNKPPLATDAFAPRCTYCGGGLSAWDLEHCQAGLCRDCNDGKPARS